MATAPSGHTGGASWIWGSLLLLFACAALVAAGLWAISERRPRPDLGRAAATVTREVTRRALPPPPFPDPRLKGGRSGESQSRS